MLNNYFNQMLYSLKRLPAFDLYRAHVCKLGIAAE